MAWPDPCEQCGQVHTTWQGIESCPQHIREAGHPEFGRPCGHPAGWGTGYSGQPGMPCMKHGGKGLGSQRRAINYLIDQAMTKEAKLLNIEGTFEEVTDPFLMFSQIAGEVVRVKDILREKVEDLKSLEDVGTDKKLTQLHVVMQAYERFLGHAARIANEMSKLDLEARVARLKAAVDSETAELIKKALAGALGEADLTAEQRQKVLTGFGNRLRPKESLNA